MVFTSLPLYLDPPNWNQQQSHHQTGGNNELQSAIQATPPSAGISTASGGGTMIRPGSMADRSRLVKIPHPEPALKCPRCDSTNTKFCYFNNYSLSQPRHFCKTCRRYWTRGGALRSVPVGGGCRRNKRSSKSSASKSNNSSAADRQAGGASSSSSSTATSGSGMIPSNFHHHHPQLPFLANLHPLSEFGAPNLGLNFHGLQPIDHAVNYQGGSSCIGLDQWRIQQLQQFPFLGGMDSSSAAVMAAAPMAGNYNPFDADQSEGFHGEVLPRATSSSLITQLASVKMEDRNPHGLNLARQYLGISGNDQYWRGGGGGTGGGSWAPGDISGFNS